MMLKAFSLFDYKADAFSPPFFVSTLGQACRSVVEAAADNRTTIGRYPQDFALMELGEFNILTGLLVPASPVAHGTVSQLLNAARDAFNKANPQFPLEPLGEPVEPSPQPLPLKNGAAVNA